MRLSPPFLCLPFPRAQSRSKSDCTTPRKKYTRMMTQNDDSKKLTSENFSGDTILTNKVSKIQMTKIRVPIKSFPVFRRVRTGLSDWLIGHNWSQQISKRHPSNSKLMVSMLNW